MENKQSGASKALDKWYEVKSSLWDLYEEAKKAQANEDYADDDERLTLDSLVRFCAKVIDASIDPYETV